MKENGNKIAVVGIGSLFPGSKNNQDFWLNILNGTDLLTEVPKDHWSLDDYYDQNPILKDKVYSRRGGFVPQIDFDPVAYGILSDLVLMHPPILALLLPPERQRRRRLNSPSGNLHFSSSEVKLGGCINLISSHSC